MDISVVIPAYNRPQRLHRCLTALARQTLDGARFEVVVVDDGSEPPLEKPAPGETVPINLVWHRQENRGPAAARNAGAELVRAPMLAFTDDDCAPAPDWLERLCEALTQEGDHIVGGLVNNALDGNNFARASQDIVSFLFDYFDHARHLLPFATTNNMAMRRDLFDRLAGFSTAFRYAASEDRDICERLVLAGGSVSFTPLARVDHFHDMSAGGFMRQHFLYGRGAVRLDRQRKSRGQPLRRSEPISFYARMLAFPYRRYGVVRATVVATLMAVAETSMILGAVWEMTAERG